jgi:type I restriction enzyme S subunit
MAGEWRECRLEELVEVYDGPHATPIKTECGPIFLGISNLAHGRLDLLNAEHLSEEDFLSWTRRVTPEAGDIIFSYETRLGEAALIPRGLRCCLGRRMGLLRARSGCADSRFLLYAYLGPEFQETLRSRTIHGSTVDRIPLIAMPRFPIRVPVSIQEQRAIAHILGTLDDKIELNRRMNETLEALARAIFLWWFVDFDPVRAKAEGRDPGLPKAVADLFPDCFEDSELGEIPAGWRVGRLDEVLVLQRGFDLPTLERTPGPYPVIAASGLNGTHNQFMVRGPGVTTGRSGVLGNVFYIHEDFWPLNTSLWVKQFKHSTPTFAFHLLRGLDFSMFNAGSAVPTLNRNHVHNLPVVIPSMSTIRTFEELSVPLLKRQKANVDESRTLVALRDMLLPELISGELRVKDAERFVKQAT